VEVSSVATSARAMTMRFVDAARLPGASTAVLVVANTVHRY
jgi:hypothetical protein